MPPIFKKPAPKKPAPAKPAPKPSSTTAARKDSDFAPPAKAKTPTAPAPKAGPPKAPASQASPEQVKPGLGQAMDREDLDRARELRPFLEDKTNQDIINVIYKAAEDLKVPPWSLIKKAKLEHLVEARKAPYSGPTVANLPGLTDKEKAAILKVLKEYVKPKK